MSAPKFTPGPWEAGSDTERTGHVIRAPRAYGEGEPGEVGLFVAGTDFRGHGPANARLIAAAPEMYEALERLARAAEIEMRDLPGPTEIDLALAASRDLLSRIRGEEVKP